MAHLVGAEKNRLDGDLLLCRQKLSESMSGFSSYPTEASKIFDFLFLGGQEDATDVRLLSRLGITHVINCAAGYCSTGKQFYDDSIRRYVEFDAEDDEDYDILQHFDVVHDVIEDARTSGGRALIHCLMGINRSGALAVAYAMVSQDWGPIRAAVYVRDQRKLLLSNETFQLQLIHFAKSRDLLHLDAKETDKQAKGLAK